MNAGATEPAQLFISDDIHQNLTLTLISAYFNILRKIWRILNDKFDIIDGTIF